MKQLVVVVALFVIGCSKQAPAPATPAPDPAQERASQEAVAKLEGFRDQMCACKDAPCALNTAEAQAAWLAASYGEVMLSAEQRTARDVATQAFGACFGKVTDFKPNPASGQAIVELSALRDQMCACKDKACADAVSERLSAVGEKYKDIQATPREIEEATKIAESLGQCMTKVYGAAP